MKIDNEEYQVRPLEWKGCLHDEVDEVYAVVYDGGWTTLIIFEKGGEYRVHTENRDPSEYLFTGATLEDAKEKAQAYHDENVKQSFLVKS
ncbi:hypothetical protein PHYNN_204 [Pantoea phage Phynn]|nr:hypothetical protein PHYNN_204 [Pantoea phage Phynn]